MGKVTVGGVEFVDILHVPMERRLQTLAALGAFLSFAFGGASAIVFLVYLLFTRFWWVTMLYMVWYIYDWDASSRGGHRLEWVRRLKSNRYLRDFFPVTLIKTAELSPENNYIFGYHPHGVMSMGGFVNFSTEATGFSEKFPGIRPYLLTLKLLHQFPMYREWLTLFGICDVSRQSIDYILKGKGNAVIIVIGGAKESMDANPGEATIVLKNRKGFVKMALRHGAHLVPVYSFGENDIYYLVLKNGPGSKTRLFQRWWQKLFGFAPILFAGRGIFNYNIGLVPYRVPINTVVGKPIPVEKDANPSQEKIDALHETYMSELEKLFNEHKAHFGYKELSIKFVE
ncbi:2-acylglycerol O-acyltransferase 2-A-like [Paramacrobiotus metropolitanus]|uniref:2-acylglycerol O-acyltransferase 2-A-like n=1 Tax=Paramacrobiotus metropolitanus TaxID=2943436 RepID=UPI002445F682|nr:2-acylglycerol O-acyltransferase 2-A-like [Paramacrobiotus metropolitanus]